MSGKSGKFLFVCGCPRSGTTAIAKLLNYHSKVILGMERYKYQIRKNESNAINPSLFYWESRYAKSKVLDKHSKSYLQENAKYRLCQSLIKRSRVQHTR
ncbi:sulfotransferase [Zarconia navalis]|uniref:sulfotransferase n=1 Tax=Zarconia navalis TaxID=2992134 RepID=UPI00386F55CB